MFATLLPLLATIPEEEAAFAIDPMNFIGNLKYMGIGMLGIAIVIGVIILITVLLNKLFKDRSQK